MRAMDDDRAREGRDGERVSRRSVLAGAAVSVGVWTVPQILTVSAAGAASGQCPCGVDLVLNGSAEIFVGDPACLDASCIPAVPTGWTTADGFRATTYGLDVSGTFYPSAADLVPAPTVPPGDNLFSGQVGPTPGTGSARQHIELGPCDGRAFTLTAYLGGVDEWDDYMVLEATFTDGPNGTGNALGPATVLTGPQAVGRSNLSELQLFTASGTVPIGAQSVTLLLTANLVVAVGHPDANLACADLVTFTLC